VHLLDNKVFLPAIM